MAVTSAGGFLVGQNAMAKKSQSPTGLSLSGQAQQGLRTSENALKLPLSRLDSFELSGGFSSDGASSPLDTPDGTSTPDDVDTASSPAEGSPLSSSNTSSRNSPRERERDLCRSIDSQEWTETERRLTVTRTLSGTTLGEKKTITKTAPGLSILSRRGARAVPTSHRLARNNDVEGVMSTIEEQGLWKVLGEVDRRGKSLLHVAVEAGSQEVVQWLVETFSDISLNIKDRDGWTVLHVACAAVSSSTRNLQMIPYLIETRRCDVKTRARDGSTPLHYFVKNFTESDSVYKKYCKVGKLLIEKGCSLLDRNDKGETPIHAAALAGRVLAIKWLVTKCLADVNITTNTGETSLHLATQAQRKGAIKELLRYGINTSIRGPNGTALDIAKLVKENELIGILEEWEAHPELHSTNIKSRKSMKILMKRRDSLIKEKEKEKLKTEKRSSGLKKSVGEESEVKNKERSKARVREMPEAHRLAKANNWEGLSKIIDEQGPSGLLRTIDWRGQTVLHVAIDQNNRSLAEKLISLYPDQIEADLNVQDNNGWSPIHVASASGNVDMLLYLLSNNRFDVTMVSSDGSTPLHYFIRSFPDSPSTDEESPNHSVNKFAAAVQMLINKGVNIRATNKNGETVLHRASMSGKAAALRWLVREENWAIDINSTTNYGDSALHLAARVGAMETVRALLDLGIDTSLRSQHGTALDVAQRAKHKEVARLLEEWTHDPNTRPNRLTFSNVGDMIECIFQSAYKEAKTYSGFWGESEASEATGPDDLGLGTSSSSTDLLTLSAAESNPSSLKSSQNSEPPSLNSSASCIDQSAIESIVASLSLHGASSKDWSADASSLKSSQSDQSEPPSLHSSANQLDTSSVVDNLMSSIFGS